MEKIFRNKRDLMHFLVEYTNIGCAHDKRLTKRPVVFMRELALMVEDGHTFKSESSRREIIARMDAIFGSRKKPWGADEFDRYMRELRKKLWIMDDKEGRLLVPPALSLDEYNGNDVSRVSYIALVELQSIRDGDEEE